MRGHAGLLALLPLRLSALRTRAGLVGPPEYRPAVKPRPTACAPPPASLLATPPLMARATPPSAMPPLTAMGRTTADPSIYSHAAACADSSAVVVQAATHRLRSMAAWRQRLWRPPSRANTSMCLQRRLRSQRRPRRRMRRLQRRLRSRRAATPPPSATSPITATRARLPPRRGLNEACASAEIASRQSASRRHRRKWPRQGE